MMMVAHIPQYVLKRKREREEENYKATMEPKLGLIGTETKTRPLLFSSSIHPFIQRGRNPVILHKIKSASVLKEIFYN